LRINELLQQIKGWEKVVSDRDSEIQALKDGIKMQQSMLKAKYQARAEEVST
jgi:hypothetical protein